MPRPGIATILLGSVLTVSAAAQPGDVPLALDTITPNRIAAHLKFLSHDLLEGRAPASRGGDLAALYLAAQFEAMGLAPGAPDGTYFQDVPIVQTTVDDSFTLTVRAGQGGETRTYAFGPEVMAFSDLESERVSATGPVVFVGHGIVAPEYNWNDYAGVDVKGKIVLAMVNDPPAPADEPDLFGGRALTYYGRWTYKFEEAARQGAEGAILIHTTESATYPWQVVQSSWSGAQYALPAEPGEPTLKIKAWVTNEVATEVARLGGRDLDELRAAASRRGFSPVPLDVTAGGEIGQEVVRQVSPNVIGLVPGRNREEAVVYTSHYDHLGMREGPEGEDLIYNGALDNASGLSGLLAIGQAFARAGATPGRSIYLVATTAEEAGLLGAEYFAAHPPVAIDRIAANINVDGLNLWGRTRDIVLLGAERSSLGGIAERLAQAHGRTLGGDPEPERGYFFRSDHFPLAKAGVPALSIADPTEYIGKGPEFAMARRQEYVDQHYHQPSDEYNPEWDFEGAVDDLRLLAELGWRVAEEPTPPAYHPSDQFARPRAGR